MEISSLSRLIEHRCEMDDRPGKANRNWLQPANELNNSKMCRNHHMSVHHLSPLQLTHHHRINNFYLLIFTISLRARSSAAAAHFHRDHRTWPKETPCPLHSDEHKKWRYHKTSIWDSRSQIGLCHLFAFCCDLFRVSHTCSSSCDSRQWRMNEIFRYCRTTSTTTSSSLGRPARICC